MKVSMCATMLKCFIIFNTSDSARADLRCSSDKCEILTSLATCRLFREPLGATK